MKLILVLLSLPISAFGDANIIDGERCNDVVLFDIMKKFEFLGDPLEMRQQIMSQLRERFPQSLSMGAICTNRVFSFPDDVTRRFCTVAFPEFKCHAIIL